MRRLSTAVVSAAAVLLPFLAVPGTAYAANATLFQAGTITADWSVIGVDLMYSGEVPHITAHVRPQGSDTEVALVTDFTRQPGGNSRALYTSPPMHLDALGDYTVDIEATSAAGEVTTWNNAGTLLYRKQPVFDSFAVDTLKPTMDNKWVGASGQLLVRDPMTRETQPVAGEPVAVTISHSDKGDVVTDEDGRFSLRRELTASGYVSATYQGTYGWATAYTPQYPEATGTKSRVVLDKGSFREKYGTKIAVTGTAEYLDPADQVWKPLPGASLRLTVTAPYCASCDTLHGTADAAGRFAINFTGLRDESRRVTVMASGSMWVLPLSTADLDLDVIAKTSFTSFSVDMDRYGQVAVSGSMRIAGGSPTTKGSIKVQYSANGKDGWSTKRTITTKLDAQFAHEPVDGYYPDGYWRLQYAGTSDIQGTTSKAVHKYRYLTKISGANASPEPARKGHTLTVKGKLSEKTSSSWKAYGGQKVKILFRPKGKSYWYDMGHATTRTDGTFGKGFTASQDGTWMSMLIPDSKHLVCVGADDYVDVT